MLDRPEPRKFEPFDIDVEQHLLGAIFRDNELLAEAGLSADDFYDPLHANIFREIQKKVGQGERATPLAVHASLKDDAGLIEVEGLKYLDSLSACAPACPDARGYGRILVDLAQRRALQELGQRFAEDARVSPAEIPTPALIAGFEAGLQATIARGVDAVPLVCAANLDGLPVPPREFLVEGLIPKLSVTLLAGDGGTGKSLASLQLAVSMQTDALFFGRVVEEGPALYISAEDDADELHRRIVAIAQDQDIPLSSLGNLHLLPLAGQDALLAVTTPAGTIEATSLYRTLEQKIRVLRPALVILDTLSDLFGGDENNRVHARQFIGLLRGLALRHQTTMLLLAHPSNKGMADGSGTSGSTGWNNSVRSRLYLTRVRNGDAEEDTDLRVLKTLKANYAAIGNEIRIRWHNGVFKLASDSASPATAAAEARAEQTFLDMLDAYTVQKRTVSASPSANFAPTVFAADRSCTVTKRGLIDAMNRLLTAGKVSVEEFGPPSKRRSRLVRTPE